MVKYFFCLIAGATIGFIICALMVASKDNKDE
jgi:hypothetical protein